MDKQHYMSELAEAYKGIFGCSPDTVSRVNAGSGSNRRYVRLSSPAGSAVATVGTVKAENKAFLYMSRHLAALGLNVPAILYASSNGMCYLQQDLGDISLAKILTAECRSGRYTAAARALLADVISTLADIQYKGARGMDWSVCYPSECFDRRMVGWDLSYFKYCFLKLTKFEIDEPALQDDFDALAEKLLEVPCDCFMYRDFQSRNVMIKDGTPYFIDFQGARRGPAHYDLVSFLWQARMNYPASLKEALTDVYIDALQAYKDVDREAFRQELRHFALFRTLQVLGAYGFRGLHEGKGHFLQSIPAAIRNLKELAAGLKEDYPYIYRMARALAADPELMNVPQLEENVLTVEVCSFSFKKGLPKDYSGNGGGYVFDVRGLNNPGRYARYDHSTGLDADVIEFIENDGGAAEYLSHIYPVAEKHVARYIERGFSHLMFSFGCTGGQHRSVYCAHALAGHLAGMFPEIKVVERHLRLPGHMEGTVR
ncbi:MAG: phosphotransferase [Bacteroidales bacterium]|nr:phosphotransferase [Bacteroidales bacterium]